MAENNKYMPSVTTTEIAEWEKRFKEAVSPLTQFDSENGQPSMRLYNGISGIDATWSGTILFKADNYVKWSYSIKASPFIEAKCNLDAEFKKVIDGLYDFYKVWSAEWSKSLSIPPTTDDVSKGSSELPAQGPPAVPGTAATPPTSMPGAIAEAYNRGESRNRNRIIEDHSDRMRRLAGI